jgi:hypothetical protein
VRRYVSVLLLLVAASAVAGAEAPKAPPSLDQLIADLEGAKKKKADATKAEAESKEALEKYVKELHEKLGKLGLNPCPPVVPPPPIIVPPPSTQADPVGATGRLRFGSSGCTATVIGPRRADGRWDVLTASHCTGGVGARGTMTMKDGRAIPVVVTARETSSDISWMVTEGVVESLPHAFLAANNPAAETGVWHMGYGVDVPGNREEGRILGATLQGQLAMELSVSSGDSGSGIFRRDTNELVAVVCCTTRKGAKVTMYGGSCERAAQLKPPIRTDTGGSWEPMDIPIVKVGG